MTDLRVATLGANQESRVALEGLIAAGVPVTAHLTLPRSETKDVADRADTAAVARAHGIQVVETSDINAPKTVAAIREAAIDYLFVTGWSQLLKNEALRAVRGKVVGSHPTPLPKGRGRAPVPWTILLGERRSAVTLFEMRLGVDDGPILRQDWFDVPERCTAGELYDTISRTLRDGFVALYFDLAAGRSEAIPQAESGGSVRARRGPRDGRIDFTAPAERVDRLVRAVSRPFPGAYSYYGDRPVTVFASSLDNVPAAVGTPGQILLKRQGWLLVQAGDAPLWLSDLVMDQQAAEPRDFALGARLGTDVEDELHLLKRQVADLRRRLGE